MEYREPGTKDQYFSMYETRKCMPYDYKNEGLLVRLLPPTVYNASNPVTHSMIVFIEKMFVWLMGYVDELKHFKNWYYHKY